MRSRGLALILTLTAALAPYAAHAVAPAAYRTLRGASPVASLDLSTQNANLFATRAGQIIELEGTVSGTISGTDSTSFLLRVGAEQTVMLCAKKDDPDIEVASTLRVLARVPAQGRLLECLAVTPVVDGISAAPATPAAEHTEMPVASRPPVIFPMNPDTAPPPTPPATVSANSPEATRIYANRIKLCNGRLGDDTACKIAGCLLDRCDRYGVDPRLMFALMTQESRFNPTAVSPAGAQGLGQLMPSTSDYLGVRKPFDIEDNIDGAVRYLAEQIHTFGRLSLALAAYNAGPKSVKRYGGIPPYRETQQYVRIIWQSYCALAGLDPATGDFIAAR